MLVGDLKARLGLDKTDFDKGLGDAAAQGNQRGSALGLAIKAGIAGALVGLGVLIGGAIHTALDAAADQAAGVRTLQTQLGVTREVAQDLGKEAIEVFKNNFGDSIQDASRMVADIRQNVKGLADNELSDVAAGSQSIADAFDEDFGQVNAATNSLMQNMGLSWQEAQDFITSGFQKGLNASGDFLDSIMEYGPQFKDMGLDAGQTFSLMETGFQNGVLGTDKAADAFKEFRLRTMAMSEDIWGADGVLRNTLHMTGDAVSHLFDGLQDGSVSVGDFYNEVMPKLAGLDNDVWRNTAGVALFGTQWEDLGPSAVMGIDLTKTAMGDLSGATSGLGVQYETFDQLQQGVWRNVQVALIPVGAKLFEIATSVMPQVQTAISWLGDNLPGIIQTGVQAVDQAVTGFTNFLVTLQPLTTFIEANLKPILAGLVTALLFVVVPAFVAWATAATAAATATIAALAPVLLPIAAIGAAVALLYAAWDADFLGIQTTLTTFWTTTGEPIFTTLKDWLAVQLTAAIATLTTFWNTTLLPALQLVWAFLQNNVIPIFQALVNLWITVVGVQLSALALLWNTVLWPALQKVWTFLDTYVIPIFKALITLWTTGLMVEIRALADLWNNLLYPALFAVWDLINVKLISRFVYLGNEAMKTAQIAAENTQKKFDDLKSVLQKAGDYIVGTFGPALSGLQGIASGVSGAINSIASAVGSAISALGRMADKIRSLPSLPSIPGFATGTRSAPGGMAWVGEQGPELINLPRGSQVYTAGESRRMAAGGGGDGAGGQIINQFYPNATFNNADVNEQSLMQRTQMLSLLGGGA